MPNIYWLIAAQRRFLEAMDGTMSFSDIRQRYEMVCRKLAATFHDAEAVIVRNRLSGYRVRGDLHILLVEVIWRCRNLEPLARAAGQAAGQAEGGKPPEKSSVGWPDFCEEELGLATQTTAHVVKVLVEEIAKDKKALAKELAAWESCRPVGMTHDSILMRLRPRPTTFDPATGPISLVYEDAHHVIGTGIVLSLEQAVLDGCAWGTPSVESIEVLLKCLFERLGADFYARSRVKDTPRENLIGELLRWKRLDTWIKGWRDTIRLGPEPQLDRLRIRREVLGFLSSRRRCFIDPVDYLRSVLACPQYCPLLLWGCSHGDLHGRNVLVTILDNDVNLPALFDYEEMSRNNPVGWDFVKLETELKARALPMVFPGPESDYIHQVRKFECYLAERTLAMHDQREETEEQKKAKDFDDPESARRLARILLMIRREARNHLGLQRLRDRQWLEEYYFLLVCYGTRAGQFDAYQGQRRQITAAYISAGVAARQLSRPWTQLEAQIREASSEATRLLKPPPSFGLATFTLKKANCEMSHHARLAFAREWARSGDPAYIRAAVKILQQLRRSYPHVLEVEEELGLAYLELGQAKDAETLLYEVSLRYSQLSEEILCRFGRLWKDKGNKERAVDPDGARRLFQAGLEWYQKGYSLRNNYYPGINVATLQFALTQPDARKTAEAVLGSLDGRYSREEQVWVSATRAEANLLLANFPPDHDPAKTCAEAERLYRQALTGSNPQARATMRRQAELILARATPDVLGYWTGTNPTKLDDVFPP